MGDISPEMREAYERAKEAFYSAPIHDEAGGTVTVGDLIRWADEINRTKPKFIVHGREAGEVVQALVDKQGLHAEVIVNEHVARGTIILANPAALAAIPYDYIADHHATYSVETPEEVVKRINDEWMEAWKDSYAKSTMKITGITT